MDSNYTLLFLFLCANWGLLQAQNCPANVAGQLSPIQSTIVASDTTPLPIYTVVPTGLPNTEFLIVRQDTLAADGFGPPILVSSLDGRVVPADLGLSTCQELCVVPFSYNLVQIQLVVDSLLNGLYIGGATCCTAAGTFFPGWCDSLNAQGIFNGSDIQDLNDVISFTDAFAGTGGAGTSIPNLVSTISQLNSFIGLFGNCAANVPEICYAVNVADSAHACYQVVLLNAATLILASPDTTVLAMTSSTYQLMGSYLPNSSTENTVWSIGMPDLGCTIDATGVLTTSTTTGTIRVYLTGTRGCQQDSVLVTIGAAIAVRTLNDASFALTASPMPFDQQLSLDLDVAAGWYRLQLLDVLGRVVRTETRTLAEGQQRWLLPTEDLPVGTYVLNVQGTAGNSSVLVVKR